MSLLTVKVDLGARSYDIKIGSDLLDQAGSLIAPLMRQKQVFIITDETVADLYLNQLMVSCQAAGLRAVSFSVPAGESSKSIHVLDDIIDSMLAEGCERGGMVVALGGGVVGDLAGFAASIVLRGIDFVQIPTTLLAQVDSSVGGKTGINSHHGKNLIGSFHQPRLVLADSQCLHSLPLRDIRAGYAEIVKMGLIDDAAFFDWLDQGNAEALIAGDEAARRHAIATSCRSKARIVAADERESGMRALLNLGHTFGHAFEAEAGYGSTLLHGEGVAIGIGLAFDMSVRLGLCPAADAQHVKEHLQRVGLPLVPPPLETGTWNAEVLYAHMMRDKKVSNGLISFVLVKGIGQAFTHKNVEKEHVIAVLNACISAV